MDAGRCFLPSHAVTGLTRPLLFIMSSNSNTKTTSTTATTSKDDPAAKKDAVKQQPQLSALEEDDEFEEFPTQGPYSLLILDRQHSDYNDNRLG
jgi:hypothetical protein